MHKAYRTLALPARSASRRPRLHSPSRQPRSVTLPACYACCWHCGWFALLMPRQQKRAMKKPAPRFAMKKTWRTEYKPMQRSVHNQSGPPLLATTAPLDDCTGTSSSLLARPKTPKIRSRGSGLGLSRALFGFGLFLTGEVILGFETRQYVKPTHSSTA